jgi:glycosyltransferase involved in cell wall biosynthesis
MRIFHVCGDPGIDPSGTKGASVHLRSLAAALERSGHEVTLFCRRRPSSDPGLAVQRFRGPSSLHEAAEGPSGPPDVVYERYSLGHADGLEAARIMRRPFVLEVNAPLVLEATKYRPDTLRPGHHRTERRLFREADLVVAVSEPLRRYIASIRGTDVGTKTVPNGCDPTAYPRPARSVRAPSTIVFLGHPKPWHGADELVALLRGLVGRGRPATLLLVGGGKGASGVFERARTAGVEHLVEITGPLPHEEAAGRIVEAAVAVAPYPPDPFFYFCPLKVVEYMAAGLPLVASALGDVPALVGDAGVLVPPGDFRALLDAVDSLLANPAQRAVLGEAGRRRARSLFTWDRVAASLIDAMASVRAGVAA